MKATAMRRARGCGSGDSNNNVTFSAPGLIGTGAAKTTFGVPAQVSGLGPGKATGEETPTARPCSRMTFAGGAIEAVLASAGHRRGSEDRMASDDSSGLSLSCMAGVDRAHKAVPALVLRPG